MTSAMPFRVSSLLAVLCCCFVLPFPGRLLVRGYDKCDSKHFALADGDFNECKHSNGSSTPPLPLPPPSNDKNVSFLVQKDPYDNSE